MRTQVADSLLLEERDEHSELLLEWWRHHSRPPALRRQSKDAAVQQQQQMQRAHDTVLQLWPWGCQAQAGMALAPDSSQAAAAAEPAAAGSGGARFVFSGAPAPAMPPLYAQLAGLQQLLPAALAEPACLRSAAQGSFGPGWGTVMKSTRRLMTR